MSEEIFLVDANTFITPYKTYYPFDFAPSFWTFLKHHIESGYIAVMGKVYAEVTKGTDDLSKWMQGLTVSWVDHRTPDVLAVYSQVLTHIQNGISAAGTSLYNDKALNEWADNSRADAWLVAAAKAKGYTLVTFERPNSSLGTSISAHPKIPDVASEFGVKYGSLYDMMRKLGFAFK
jgi:hypothetical protein